MARSIPFLLGSSESYLADIRVLPKRGVLSRVLAWLTEAQQRRADRQIARFLRDAGIERISDSLEREIEHRFLARKQERW
jgi:hypothetical protein